MVIRLGFLSTVIPLRAMSYRRFPLILTAEYIGGICSISPLKSARAFSSCSRVTELSFSESVLPQMSSVSVVIPSLNDAVYSLSWFGMMS